MFDESSRFFGLGQTLERLPHLIPLILCTAHAAAKQNGPPLRTEAESS